MLEQPPGGARQQVGDALGGGVRAVGDAEGVVDVHVGELRQGTREGRVVGGLALLEAHVLQQQHLPVVELFGERLDLLADHRRRQRDLRAGQLAQARGHRRHRQRLIAMPVRAAEMGDQHQARALAAQLFDRGQRRADAGVVGELHLPARAGGERDVEVHAHQHAPPVHVEVVKASHAIPPDLASEDPLREVHEPVGVAPLVVVPGHDLQHRSVHHRGELGVDDRGVGRANDVAGDDRVLGVGHDPV